MPESIDLKDININHEALETVVYAVGMLAVGVVALVGAVSFFGLWSTKGPGPHHDNRTIDDLR